MKNKNYYWLSDSIFDQNFRFDVVANAVTPQNVYAVCKMYIQDGHVIYCEIEAAPSIDKIPIQTIMDSCTKWIPKMSTNTQKVTCQMAPVSSVKNKN